MQLLFPLAKGHLSNVATFSWQTVALLEGENCKWEDFKTYSIISGCYTVVRLKGHSREDSPLERTRSWQQVL